MLVMFILGLILIGMLALVANSLSGMYSSLNDLSTQSRERQIEMIWESGLSSILVQAGPNGEYIAPIGASITSEAGVVVGHTLPISVAGPRLNVKGIAPHYCALGRANLSGGVNRDVIVSPGVGYKVESVTVGSIDYVARSEDLPGMQRGNSSVVAFIISPFERTEGLSCAKIAYDQQSGQYEVPGVNSKVIAIYGSNGGTLGPGEAINRSSSQFIDASLYPSLNEALAPYLSNPPRRLIVNLPDRAQSYAITADLEFGRKTASDAELVIVGGGSGAAKIDGGYSLSIKNAKIVLANINTESALRASDSKIEVSGSTFGSTDLINSELVIGGTNTIAGKLTMDNSKVDQEGGLVINHSASDLGAVDMAQSTWRIRNGSLSIGGSSEYGIWIDQGSRISAKGSTISLAGNYGQAFRIGADSVLSSIDSTLQLSGGASYFADVKGRLIATGGAAYATGSVQSGAVLRDGGSILLDNDQQWFSTGRSPLVGVFDLGGLSVAGASAQVGGSACWQGYLFSESTAGQVTNNNNEIMQGRVTASWSCSQ